ncbi:hypothetical protein, partial [Novipirellula rosea]
IERFAALLASSFGFEPHNRCSHDGAALHIGTDRPMAGIAFPVYLQHLRFADAMLHAIDSCDGPFIFFRWKTEPIDERTRRWLERRSALLLTINEIAAMNDRGEFDIAESAKVQVDSFRKMHLPNIDAGKPGVRFATPAGSRWSQVAIRFKDDDCVQVTIGDASQIYNFTQMGLVDARNGRPTKQWELLRMMAAQRGIYTWHSPGACRKNKKRREVLSKQLREFFGIDGDPIELTDDKKGYRTVFKLLPQGE